MSILDPEPVGNGEARLQFAEMMILVDYKSDKNGNQYARLTWHMTPIEAGQEVKKYTSNTARWDSAYREVTFPSIQERIKAGELASVDDLLTKTFFVAYQAPKFLIKASANDIQWHKDNGKLDRLEMNEIGQPMRANYPVKLVKIYPDRAAWLDAHKALTVTTPAAPNPERDACLVALKETFVKSALVLKDGALVDVDTFKLEADLHNPPFNKYFTIDSPAIKEAVAAAIVARLGNQPDAIKGICLQTGGWLDYSMVEPLIKENVF